MAGKLGWLGRGTRPDLLFSHIKLSTKCQTWIRLQRSLERWKTASVLSPLRMLTMWRTGILRLVQMHHCEYQLAGSVIRSQEFWTPLWQLSVSAWRRGCMRQSVWGRSMKSCLALRQVSASAQNYGQQRNCGRSTFHSECVWQKVEERCCNCSIFWCSVSRLCDKKRSTSVGRTPTEHPVLAGTLHWLLENMQIVLRKPLWRAW